MLKATLETRTTKIDKAKEEVTKLIEELSSAQLHNNDLTTKIDRRKAKVSEDQKRMFELENKLGHVEYNVSKAEHNANKVYVGLKEAKSKNDRLRTEIREMDKKLSETYVFLRNAEILVEKNKNYILACHKENNRLFNDLQTQKGYVDDAVNYYAFKFWLTNPSPDFSSVKKI